MLPAYSWSGTGKGKKKTHIVFFVRPVGTICNFDGFVKIADGICYYYGYFIKFKMKIES
jgi:hypothetical protein